MKETASAGEQLTRDETGDFHVAWHLLWKKEIESLCKVFIDSGEA